MLAEGLDQAKMLALGPIQEADQQDQRLVKTAQGLGRLAILRVDHTEMVQLSMAELWMSLFVLAVFLLLLMWASLLGMELSRAVLLLGLLLQVDLLGADLLKGTPPSGNAGERAAPSSVATDLLRFLPLKYLDGATAVPRRSG